MKFKYIILHFINQNQAQIQLSIILSVLLFFLSQQLILTKDIISYILRLIKRSNLFQIRYNLMYLDQIQKQTQHQKNLMYLPQKQKKNRKARNPYNINISFNINNPKKVISNHINKTIKVNHYSLAEQCANVPNKKQNISKILSLSSKNPSSSLSKSKQVSKYQCYFENPSMLQKKNKKSKTKSSNLETKSKSDFTYTTSILNMPFPGNDPLPEAAIKKLNKMKKYFLQKIGSMDITMPENDPQKTSSIIQQESLPKQIHTHSKSHKKQEANIETQKQKNQNDEIMTQKLSEYQYQNLISYENEENNNDSIMKSKQLFDYEMTQTFPQIVLDSFNSMSMKNEYLRHHSKFLNQNMKLFQNNSPKQQSKMFKKSKRLSHENSYDLSHKGLKSKILHSIQQTQKSVKRHQKQFKSCNLSQLSHFNENKKLKQKIQIIHDLLLKSQSSHSILEKVRKQKDLITLNQQSDVGLKVYEHYQKNIKKQFVIKTEIDLSNDLMKQIKKFQQGVKNEKNDESLKEMNKNPHDENIINSGLNYFQFLNERDRDSEKKQTNAIIQTYIDILNEQSNFEGQIKKFGDEVFKQDQQQGENLSYMHSSKQSLSQKSLYSQTEQINRVPSQVSSYIYGQNDKSQSSQHIEAYSPERIQKIKREKQMREDLFKRMSKLAQDEPNPKIITNSNSLEHSIIQNNSDLEYKKKTQSISEMENSKQQSQLNQTKLHTQQNSNKKNFQLDHTEVANLSMNQQVDDLLVFVKKNIYYHSNDKKILKDLYDKLIQISASKNILAEQFDEIKKDQIEQVNSVKDKIFFIKNQTKQNFLETETPKKNLSKTKKLDQIKGINHKRTYSIQKDHLKPQQSSSSTDDLSLWDLYLVQERLNKKYNEIILEKEKKLFEIQSDTTLNPFDYEVKVNQLDQWYSQTKKQVLQTKKHINKGIDNLRKIFEPNLSSMSLKMKCLSQKYLQSKFHHSFLKIQGEQQIKKDIPNNIETNEIDIKISCPDEPEYERKEEDHTYSNYISRLQLNLDNVFKNNKISKQTIVTNKQSESDNSINEKQELLLSPTNYFQGETLSQRSETSPQVNEQSKHTKLLRTTNIRKDDERNDSSSLGSQHSSDFDTFSNEKAVFNEQDSTQKQQFIDLLKIQKYKLKNFHQLQEESINQQNQHQSLVSKEINHVHEIQVQQKRLKKHFRDFKVSEEDKVDICEFILLDLCIELYQETLDVEDSQIRLGKYQKTSANRIIDSIFNYIKKEKKKPKKKGPKIGIYTQLTTVKEYVQKIKNHIETLKQKNPNYLSKTGEHLLINRVKTPIGPTASQILRTMRFYEDDIFEYRQEQGSCQNSQNQGLNSLILPVYVFTDFEETLQKDKQFIFDTYFEDAQKQKNRLIFLRNVTHVHHKAIFDALNEMLDFERPFGIWGKPFPWKKRNDKEKKMNQIDVKNALKSSCNKIVQCAMYMCGLLVDKEESLIKNTNVSETYIQEVKQDRMSKMIVNDFLENQNRFYFLDDQETQILLETSYVIWLLLIQQALREFKTIINKKNSVQQINQ